MYKNSDFIAGAFVIGAFILMLWATIILGGHKGAFLEFFTGKENRTLTIQFENISGLGREQSRELMAKQAGASFLNWADGLCVSPGS